MMTRRKLLLLGGLFMALIGCDVCLGDHSEGWRDKTAREGSRPRTCTTWSEKVYAGTISPARKIRMYLRTYDRQLTGFYIDLLTGNRISLKGEVGLTGRITLKEGLENGESCVFTGSPASGARIVGVWRDEKGRDNRPIDLKMELTDDPVADFLDCDGAEPSKTGDSDLYKMEADFNNDGLKDVAVSATDTDPANFTVYLRERNGFFHESGWILCPPGHLSIGAFSKGCARVLTDDTTMPYIVECEILINNDCMRLVHSIGYYIEEQSRKTLYNRYKHQQWPTVYSCRVIKYMKDRNCAWSIFED